jgi:hypothetical protein
MEIIIKKLPCDVQYIIYKYVIILRSYKQVITKSLEYDLKTYVLLNDVINTYVTPTMNYTLCSYTYKKNQSIQYEQIKDDMLCIYIEHDLNVPRKMTSDATSDATGYLKLIKILWKYMTPYARIELLSARIKWLHFVTGKKTNVQLPLFRTIE